MSDNLYGNKFMGHVGRHSQPPIYRHLPIYPSSTCLLKLYYIKCVSRHPHHRPACSHRLSSVSSPSTLPQLPSLLTWRFGPTTTLPPPQNGLSSIIVSLYPIVTISNIWISFQKYYISTIYIYQVLAFEYRTLPHNICYYKFVGFE